MEQGKRKHKNWLSFPYICIGLQLYKVTIMKMQYSSLASVKDNIILIFDVE